ncbi:hypothetical protein RE735_14155 [Bacillus aerius]|nr:hypothetical protein [Bacillus aerius]WMT28261.1 hypothetical protein RE735_14155 [Bacillus aerius]
MIKTEGNGPGLTMLILTILFDFMLLIFVLIVMFLFDQVSPS